jgi:hypothetical protein
MSLPVISRKRGREKLEPFGRRISRTWGMVPEWSTGFVVPFDEGGGGIIADVFEALADGVLALRKSFMGENVTFKKFSNDVDLKGLIGIDRNSLKRLRQSFSDNEKVNGGVFVSVSRCGVRVITSPIAAPAKAGVCT